MKLNNLSMIVAAAENNVIGRNNKLLWHLPNDLKRFKELTTGKPIIMGKNTYFSLPKRPLPNRTNVVLCNDDSMFLTSSLTYADDANIPNLLKFDRIDDVLNFIKETDEECFIIGGAMIYKLFLPYINKLYITKVFTSIQGDVYFPDFDGYEWDLIGEEKCFKDDKHSFDYTFFTYIKK